MPLLTSVVVKYGIAYDASHDTGHGPAGGVRRTAMLFTNGVEAFHLRLGGRPDLPDFDHESSGQGEVTNTLAGVERASAGRVGAVTISPPTPRRSSHLGRGDLSDALVYDAVRVRLI